MPRYHSRFLKIKTETCIKKEQTKFLNYFKLIKISLNVYKNSCHQEKKSVKKRQPSTDGAPLPKRKNRKEPLSGRISQVTDKKSPFGRVSQLTRVSRKLVR